MLLQRLIWGGGTIISALTVYLSWAQVADGLAKWAFAIIGGLFFIASMVMFPWGQDDDGTSRRLINVAIRGRNNPSVVATDTAQVTGPVQVSGRSTLHQHGLTVGQIDELKKYIDGEVVGEVERFVNQQMVVVKADFVKYTGQAYDQALSLGQHLLTEFVEKLAMKAPENIESIKSVAMQQAILNAQTSAAVADNDELTETLVDILIDKSGAEPRSFKGVVLTEALQVAGKLTADQVNLLTAVVILSRTIVHDCDTVDLVLHTLDSRCRPLYSRIPTSKTALEYMAYTGVGDIRGFGPRSISDQIIRTYDGVFTQGFTAEQLPTELQAAAQAVLPQVDQRIVVEEGRLRFPVPSSQTLDHFKDTGQLNEPYASHTVSMKSLMKNNYAPTDKFVELVESAVPELSQFLRDFDQIGAADFTLSSVGIAVGHANWRRLQPDLAPPVDIYL